MCKETEKYEAQPALSGMNQSTGDPKMLEVIILADEGIKAAHK